MARFRTQEEITLSMLDFLQLAQPDADIKPGTVIRDMMIDMPASEIAKLYNELRTSAGFQNIYSLAGTDLDKYARNYGIRRLEGSVGGGVVVLTTNNLDSNITIPAGTIIPARNGQSATTTVEVTMDASKPTLYRSTALRLSADLEIAGISDQFAIEVPARATFAGRSGNFGRFQLRTPSVPGISNGTNINQFAGGDGIETDAAFRTRILAIWAGANLGTAGAYLAAVTADSRVITARVVEPGDTEMIRDGTVVGTDPDGNKFILSPGTGGKVDVIVQGEDLIDNTESFTYVDRSGRGDATDVLNHYVIGQRGISPSLSYIQRRKNFFDNGILPFQPVNQILQVSGSISGPNFIEGVNYELEPDTGVYRGSPFAQDKLKFISNSIALSGEQIPKVQVDSQDPLDYTAVSYIRSADQLVQVLREVVVSDPTDRSMISLAHTPITSVDRVINTTTGERYRIVSQNPDGVSGQPNTSGRVQIIGATLPRSTDVLEASYTWNIGFDKDSDFDNLQSSSRVRTAQDSIDWGFANRVELEETGTLYSGLDGYHILLEQPISRVVNVYTYTEEVVAVSSGKLILSNPILNILSVKNADGKEGFSTLLSDGTVAGSTITLPTDTIFTNGENITVRYNITDIYSPDTTDAGSFTGNKIILANYDIAGTPVLVDYVVSIPEYLPITALTSLPATSSENVFVVSNTWVGTQPSFHGWISSQRDSLRRVGPSYLRISFSNIPSSGRLLVTGLVSKKIDVTYTNVTSNQNAQIDLSDVIASVLGTLPSDALVTDVVSMKRVTVSGNNETVDFEYDLQNFELKTNLWSRAATENVALSNTTFGLSLTQSNLDNKPLSGDKIHIVFYVQYTAAERIGALSSGIQFSKNKYFYISDVRVDAGFRNLSNVLSGEITILPYTQPESGTQFNVDYDYQAPKEGERITLQYTYNRLLADLLQTIEDVRPVGADVLPRAADKILLDVDIDIVSRPNFTNTTSLAQSVRDKLSEFIRNSTTDGVIDASDIVNIAYDVAGIDRVTLNKFNLSGQTGIKKSIYLQKDQFFSAGDLVVTLTTR